MTKAERLIGEIKKPQAELDKHQNRCKHPKGGSVSNYDPYEDRYWTDYKCSICGKEWTEELIK